MLRYTIHYSFKTAETNGSTRKANFWNDTSSLKARTKSTLSIQ